ncbi:ribonuclease H [Senna tora]|uniref:Ribonuclease H n=1 Tax=Senna tora TaxID=362788 RepID=A0A834WIN6_9FABA|nr:ribonuclease H [Senna tora]
MWMDFFSLNLRDWISWNHHSRADRNKVVFENLKSSIDELYFTIFNYSRDVSDSSNELKISLGSASTVTRLVGWQTPSLGTMKCNVDGSVQGNSSRAACGGVVRDGVGNAILSFSRNLGCCTITWAELHGIMDGLELLWSRGVRTVEIETDSATATTLIYDNSNGSHPCTQLINRIKLLLSRPWNVSIKHVYRECNKVADFMAKFGQELSHGLHVFEHVPEGCLDLLEQDGLGVVFPRVVAG